MTNPAITEAIKSAMHMIRVMDDADRARFGYVDLISIREHVKNDIQDAKETLAKNQTYDAARLLPKSFEDHRIALSVAARSAQQFGATAKQVDYLARLFADAGEISVYSSGRLTKSEASNIIASMTKQVA